ncbi:hypothetical protein ACROYT_G043394 [Oculina patagonica]
MSWFIPVLVGFLAIYLIKRLIPRLKLDVKDKYVLITGCDSGFGRETAIRLDEMEVHVIATCLTKEGEESLKSATSDKLKTFQMDVTKSKQIDDVCKEVNRMIPYGTGLWGLVNNAGIVGARPIEWAPLNLFKRIADVNLWGMIDVTKTFLPLVKKSRGRVVNFASVAGRLSTNFFGPYSVSKYGVEAFSDALRREMHPWGIKVSIMEPGSFKTSMNDAAARERQLRQAWDSLSEELKKEYGEEYLEKCISFFNGFTSSPHTYQVVDAVVDALTSQTPRDRYLVGLDAQFFFASLAWLPTVVTDFYVTRVLFRNIVPLGGK